MTDDQAPGFGQHRAVTPLAVQQKEFRVQRFGGYKMREVDEFLDELTGSIADLLADNERLRRRGEGAPPVIGSPDLDDVNRQADEIIERARAEAARIVGEARGGVAPATSDADRGAVNAFLANEREFLQRLAGLVQDHAGSVKSLAKQASPVVAERQAPAAAAAPASPERSQTPTSETTQLIDEPIRVDEPEPAAATADDTEASLRQLFWGEEN